MWLVTSDVLPHTLTGRALKVEFVSGALYIIIVSLQQNNKQTTEA